FVHGSGLDEILAYRRKVGTTWEDYHILHGGQDTAAKLVNQSGQVVEQYEYDPFGKATVYTAAGALVDVGPAGTSPEDGTRSAYGLMHLYKAMRLDPETGNCYVRNRYYDPRTGRFMSRDPIGVWGDAGNMGNEYAYAWNRPLVISDPFGLDGEPQWHHIVTQTGLRGGNGKENGILLPGGVGGDHGFLHGNHTMPDHWNVAAAKVDAANPGLKNDPQAFLKAMKAEYASLGTDRAKRVLELLELAPDAPISYDEWSALSKCPEKRAEIYKNAKEAKEKAVREAAEKAEKAAKEAAEKADRAAKEAAESASALARAGSRAVKILPLAGLFFGGCQVAGSDSVGEAVENGVDMAIGEIPIVGSVYDGGIAAYYFGCWLVSKF
ncbi:MAG: RHS repeat domain-containing protein, partial [Planctomycetota bacterium]